MAAHVKTPAPPIELSVGEHCNVRTGRHEPLTRVVKSAGWKKRKDGLWYEWSWTPEPRADGRMDCGYSGVRMVDADGSLTEEKFA